MIFLPSPPFSIPSEFFCAPHPLIVPQRYRVSVCKCHHFSQITSDHLPSPWKLSASPQLIGPSPFSGQLLLNGVFYPVFLMRTSSCVHFFFQKFQAFPSQLVELGILFLRDLEGLFLNAAFPTIPSFYCRLLFTLAKECLIFRGNWI